MQLKNNELAVLIDITKEKLLLARPQSGIKTYSIDDFLKITESDSEIIGHLLMTIKREMDNLKIEDYRLVINNGSEAGQTVFHLHIHILAQRTLGWPPG